MADGRPLASHPGQLAADCSVGWQGKGLEGQAGLSSIGTREHCRGAFRHLSGSPRLPVHQSNGDDSP